MIRDNYADLRAGDLGKVRDSHAPSNAECPHNADAMLDCNCKRKVTRKPYRVLRVNDPSADRAHRIVAEVHPNGLLVLRQQGRRKRVSITLGALYERLVWNEARQIAAAAKAKRAPGSKRRRK